MLLDVSTKGHTKQVDTPSNTLHEDVMITQRHKRTYRVQLTLPNQRESERREDTDQASQALTKGT